MVSVKKREKGAPATRQGSASATRERSRSVDAETRAVMEAWKRETEAFLQARYESVDEAAWALVDRVEKRLGFAITAELRETLVDVLLTDQAVVDLLGSVRRSPTSE